MTAPEMLGVLTAQFLDCQADLNRIMVGEEHRMPALEPRDLNNLAGLCEVIRVHTPEDTPVQCALVRLADATGKLLTTCVEGTDSLDNQLIVAAWRQADHDYRLLSAQAGE
jgi:hypothetical protein